MQNACARGTRTPSTRAARARALFLKNVVLHANMMCARAVLKIMILFSEKIYFSHFVLFVCLKQYKVELGLELFSQEQKIQGE